jgi:DNA-binding CsgD family transcriptional regulator
LRFALAGALRAWCAENGGLLAIDDGQWIDPESADVLSYALRRVAGGLGCVVAARAASPVRLEGTWTTLDVRPLTGDDIADLLSAHGLPCRLAGPVHVASGGFPLWAVELGKALADSSNSLPPKVRALIAGRLAELPDRTREVLLAAALARRPNVALLRRAGWPDADLDLRPAIAAGLVVIDPDGHVAFAGSAIAGTLVQEAGWTRRAEAHRRLAGAVHDDVDRVRHRALAGRDLDPGLAAELAAAAVTVREAGDRDAAAELGLLAAERAPDCNDPELRRIIVDATADAAAAGRADLVRQGEALLDRIGTPTERTRARLAVIRTAGQSLTGLADTFARALADAEGDPGLQAEVHLRLAVRANLTEGDPARARREADLACALARLAHDHDLLAAALTMRARAERLVGDAAAERTLAEALQLTAAARPVNDSAPFLAARHALFDDRLTDARAAFLGLLPVAERSGAAEDIVDVLRGLAEVEARSGWCTIASAYARRAAALTETAGLSPGPAWFTMALTEAAGGSLHRARTYALHAAKASEEEHDVVFLARSLSTLGLIELMTGDPDAAEEALGRVLDLERTSGVVDPSVLRWHGDLVIALGATGRQDEARALLEEVRPTAERLDRRGVLGALDHAEGLMLAASGRLEDAEEALDAAVERFGALGLPLEQGRALLGLAQIARRRRRKAQARALLARADAIFTGAEARPWQQLARDAAARLDSGATGLDVALTETEARVAAHVARGASNREIAVALSISVKTVESMLTRIYRKRGVRSRTQLIAALRA